LVPPGVDAGGRLDVVGDLTVDTAVEARGDGRYAAALHEDWRIWGPNGGYLSVIALRAAGAASNQPRPASVAVHFLGVADFAPVDIEVATLRATKRAESLRVSVSQDGKPVLEAMVWAVADGIESLEHDEAPLPDGIPAPESLPTMEERMAEAGTGSPFPFWVNIDNRSMQWSPEWPPPGPLPTLSRWWCRFRPSATFTDRWVDAGRTLLLLDTMGWPAASSAHAWRGNPDGSPAFIAPNVDLHATFNRFDPDEEWLLVEARSPAGADGLLNAQVSVWSAAGSLLGTGAQTMLARRVAG
jgi:acyl-CoA thioesterase-2